MSRWPTLWGAKLVRPGTHLDGQGGLADAALAEDGYLDHGHLVRHD